MFVPLTLFAVLLLFLGWNTIKIVHTREACVVERLGKFRAVLNPGMHILIPFLDRIAYRHEAREQVLYVTPQDCITSDNIQVTVQGVLYLKVTDPEKASYGIDDYTLAAINLAQTTMRSEIGKLTLGQSFSRRERLNEAIVREIDRASDSWGVKILRYEMHDITPSAAVVATLEKQMEAERERRAEITRAEAERESVVNVSAGERQEAINLSEGEKQRRINESEGRARSIEIVAEASAAGTALVAKALSSPGGNAAQHLQIAQEYVDAVGEILETAEITVMPVEMANLQAVLEGVGELTHDLPTVRAGLAGSTGGAE